MLNIVVPMAGAGSRFAKAGFKLPKPLIDVLGRPMIQLVVENLTPRCEHRFIFICQKTHIADYDLKDKLLSYAPGCAVVEIDGLTDGAACTVLAAKAFFNNADPMMIANSDQFIDADIDQYLQYMESEKLDGLIMTMTADDPKWSFAEIDSDGLVSRVVEKEVISNEATVGIYNFRRGADFVLGAEKMIQKKKLVNGEYYVAPVYDELIEAGSKIGVFNIGAEGDGMYGLGIPDDLAKFISNPKVGTWLK